MAKQNGTDNTAIIEQLRKIRWVDKYHTFGKIVPGVDTTPEKEQEIIIGLLEDCCTELIRLYLAKKPPTVAVIRTTILRYMDLISYANVSTENRDFGYELCWYIAEKTGISIRKYTETKVYGYWRVEDNRLKEVTKRGKKAKSK
ncbi:MAG: hypothetical protein H3C54_15025 [Taibaiella sp.]|nr:hypothetical protein [Taibaiella sp.]